MNEQEQRSVLWLRLARAPGVGPVTGMKLIKQMGGLEYIFQASAKSLRRVKGLKDDTRDALLDPAERDKLLRQFEYCRENGITVAGPDQPEYPAALRQIPDPPLALYIKGSLPEGDDYIAMVGCRNPDPYGESMAASLAAGLARYQVVIDSGMARGIDGIAQRSALKAGGRTVAVLGTGVDVVYPPEHQELYENIVENGAVVSELPPGTRPEAGNFPRRNRIIAGLAKGVIMVQAMSEKSGALITVRHALDQGREVYAVPGNAGSRGGRIGNSLVKQGARLVESAEDILCDLLPVGSLLAEEDKSDKEKEDDIAKRLPDLQGRVYALVPTAREGTVDVDALARQAGVSSHQAGSVLLELELAGLVKALPGKRYVRLSRA
ncbi:MAG: DNA-processing protein DprA [bacterium]